MSRCFYPPHPGFLRPDLSGLQNDNVTRIPSSHGISKGIHSEERSDVRIRGDYLPEDMRMPRYSHPPDHYVGLRPPHDGVNRDLRSS